MNGFDNRQKNKAKGGIQGKQYQKVELGIVPYSVCPPPTTRMLGRVGTGGFIHPGFPRG